MATPRKDRHLLCRVREKHYISVPGLRMLMLRPFGRHTTAWTVINQLMAAGYRTQRPHRLTLLHRHRHREWGQRHRVWHVCRWRHCVLSDESRFSLYHSDGSARVHWRQGDRLMHACIQPTHGSWGPSVMVWDAIHDGSKKMLVILDGKMDRHRYIQTLRDHMLPWVRGVLGRNIVFVHDNALPYEA